MHNSRPSLFNDDIQVLCWSHFPAAKSGPEALLDITSLIYHSLEPMSSDFIPEWKYGPIIKQLFWSRYFHPEVPK